jgi:hypothetical protein
MNGRDQAGGADSWGEVGRVMIASIEEEVAWRGHGRDSRKRRAASVETGSRRLFSVQPTLLNLHSPVRRQRLPNPYAHHPTAAHA